MSYAVPTVLRCMGSYAAPTSLSAYVRAMRCPVLRERMVLCNCDAIYGTELAYLPTRVFGWDDVFVLGTTHRTYAEMLRESGIKISPRYAFGSFSQQVVAQYWITAAVAQHCRSTLLGHFWVHFWVDGRGGTLLGENGTILDRGYGIQRDAKGERDQGLSRYAFGKIVEVYFWNAFGCALRRDWVQFRRRERDNNVNSYVVQWLHYTERKKPNFVRKDASFPGTGPYQPTRVLCAVR
eukprot:246122-Rhodomonas_salina.1